MGITPILVLTAVLAPVSVLVLGQLVYSSLLN